jgi:glycosyltransferase involved in cell wall biosynthesis
MTSVVIAAHNESAVIRRCLDALFVGVGCDDLDVTVVANGCTDDTVAIAAAQPLVRVVEITVASKPAALNAGDEVAVGFPRIYLDADIVVPPDGIRLLSSAVSAGVGQAAVAAVPGRRLDVTGRPLLVRAYFAINRRLPAFRDGLFGRGMIALSEDARARFDRFPAMIADDLFLDSLFRPEEKREVSEVSVLLATPRRTRDLVRRLTRVRRGNAAMRTAGSSGHITIDVRTANRLSWLRDVVLPRPWLAPAGAGYAALTALAAVRARRIPTDGNTWERDESTRAVAPDTASAGEAHG